MEVFNATKRPGIIGWFFNPYVQLGLGAFSVTISELFLKKGAATLVNADSLLASMGIAALGSYWTWIGILCYVASFVSWIYVLRFVPLGIAFAIVNAAHILVPIGCWLVLHETISPKRWLGIGLVLLGLMLLIQQVVSADRRIETIIKKGAV